MVCDINPPKLCGHSLAAPGFWFGGGESRGNGSEGASAGGPGGEGPPDGSEVSFLKTIQSIRK